MRITYAQKDLRRIYYQQSKTLTEDVLAQSYAGGEIRIEMAATVGMFGDIKVSDRPKYVGSNFFDGRAELPKIQRKLPPLLSTQLSFSELELNVNNCDGKYNKFLIGGNEYTPLFGSTMILSVGLNALEDTYFPVFRGIVHTEGGLERNRKVLTIRARDEFEYLNSNVPLPKITKDEFINAPDDVIGKTIPLCIGDWSHGIDFQNSPLTTNMDVLGNQVEVKTRKVDKVAGGTIGYFVGYDGHGGGHFLFGVGGYGSPGDPPGGGSFVCQTIEDCVIKRGDYFIKVSFESTTVNLLGYFAVKVNGVIRESDGETVSYTYSNGDVVVIKTKVGFIGPTTFDDADANPINLARMFLVVCGRLRWNEDFSSSWDTVAANNSTEYPQSNMQNGIKARIWVGESNTNILEYAIGLLRQVRCDLYVNKQRKFSVSPLFHELIPSPGSMTRSIQATHVMEGSIQIKSDKRNLFTSAECTYGFTPVLNGTSSKSDKWVNNLAIMMMGNNGEIAKSIDLPNLYREDDAIMQLKEMIRFYSAGIETITANVGWLHINAELGDWVNVSLPLGTILDEGEVEPREMFYRVPCQIRSMSVEPHGGSIEMEFLSMANFPVPEYVPPGGPSYMSSWDQEIEKG